RVPHAVASLDCAFFSDAAGQAGIGAGCRSLRAQRSLIRRRLAVHSLASNGADLRLGGGDRFGRLTLALCIEFVAGFRDRSTRSLLVGGAADSGEELVARHPRRSEEHTSEL